MRGSWDHLLGGYATNTLTEEEKRQLFQAALHNQELFDALADEEELKAMLADPEDRRKILASLKESGRPSDSILSPGSKLGWVLPTSSLGWAGSIAALGLVLIFAWQFEKEWHPLKSQEKHVALEAIKEESPGEVMSPPQKNGARSLKMKGLPESGEPSREPEVSDSIPASTPVLPPAVSEPKRLEERASSLEPEGLLGKGARLKSTPSTLPKETEGLDAVLTERSEPVSRRADHSEVQKHSEVDQGPGIPEKQTFFDSDNSFVDSPFLAELERKKERSAIYDVRAIFYGARENRKNKAMVEGQTMERGAFRLNDLSETKTLPQEKPLDSMDDKIRQSTSGLRKGIRYRIIRDRGSEKELTETMDENFKEEFSGNTTLEMESNVAGHLYVFASLGKGKWQSLRPSPSNGLEQASEGIRVLPHKIFQFFLNQVPPEEVEKSVWEVVAILSPSPIEEIGKFLSEGQSPNLSPNILFEHTPQGVFAVDPESQSEGPLWLGIKFGKEGT